MALILASASPRRADLLDQLGLAYEVRPSHVDESMLPGEAPAAYVERLAREKALGQAGPDPVIAADTVVVHESRVLGKPAHPAEARTMLQRLAGSEHDVFTGLAVAADGQVASLVDVTGVRMLAMTDVEIDTYISGGEPMDKAGAYALQGRGGAFIEAVNGSPFTVIGMPIHLLDRLASRVGVDLAAHSRGGPPGTVGAP